MLIFRMCAEFEKRQASDIVLGTPILTFLFARLALGRLLLCEMLHASRVCSMQARSEADGHLLRSSCLEGVCPPVKLDEGCRPPLEV